MKAIVGALGWIAFCIGLAIQLNNPGIWGAILFFGGLAVGIWGTFAKGGLRDFAKAVLRKK